MSDTLCVYSQRTGKVFRAEKETYDLQTGDRCIIESDLGGDLGEIVKISSQVCCSPKSRSAMTKIIRKATPEDIDKFEWLEQKEKQAFKRELIQTKMGLQDSIRLELKEATLALDEAGKNIPTTEKAVEQAEENLRVSEERYKAQVTTSTEVLDAQTLLTQARTNHYNAIYDEKLARGKLLRALGTY